MSKSYEVLPGVQRRMLKWTLFNLKAGLLSDTVTLRMSTGNQGAQFIGLQDGRVQLWAMDNDQLGHRERTFLIAGTGHLLPHNMLDYLGTVQWEGLVLHIFELFE